MPQNIYYNNRTGCHYIYSSKKNDLPPNINDLPPNINDDSWINLGYEDNNPRDEKWLINNNYYKEFNMSPLELSKLIITNLNTSPDNIYSIAYNATNDARVKNGYPSLKLTNVGTTTPINAIDQQILNFSYLLNIPDNKWPSEFTSTEDFLRKMLKFMASILEKKDIFPNQGQKVPFLELTKLTLPMSNHSGLPPSFPVDNSGTKMCSWNSPMDSLGTKQYNNYSKEGIYLQLNHLQIAYILFNTFFGNSLNVHAGMYNNDLNSLLYCWSKCADGIQMINIMAFTYRMYKELNGGIGNSVIYTVPKHIYEHEKPSYKFKNNQYNNMPISPISVCNMDNGNILSTDTTNICINDEQCGGTKGVTPNNKYNAFNDTNTYKAFKTTNENASNQMPYGNDQFNQKVSPNTIVVDISGANVGGYSGLCQGQFQDEGLMTKFLEVPFFHFFSYTPTADAGAGHALTSGLGAPALFLGVRMYSNVMNNQSVLPVVKITGTDYKGPYAYENISPINEDIPTNSQHTTSLDDGTKIYNTGFLSLVTTDVRDFKNFTNDDNQKAFNFYDCQQQIYQPYNSVALSPTMCISSDTTAFDMNLDMTYRCINPNYYPSKFHHLLKKKINKIGIGNLGYGDFMNDPQASMWFTFLAFTCATNDLKNSNDEMKLAYYLTSRNIECCQISCPLFETKGCNSCINYNKETWGVCSVRDARKTWCHKETCPWYWQWNYIEKGFKADCNLQNTGYNSLITKLKASNNIDWTSIYNTTIKERNTTTPSLFTDLVSKL